MLSTLNGEPILPAPYLQGISEARIVSAAEIRDAVSGVVLNPTAKDLLPANSPIPTTEENLKQYALFTAPAEKSTLTTATPHLWRRALVLSRYPVIYGNEKVKVTGRCLYTKGCLPSGIDYEKDYDENHNSAWGWYILVPIVKTNL